MKKVIAAMAVCGVFAALLLSQGPPTPTVQGSPNGALQAVPFYSGTNLIYLCEANSQQAVSLVTVSGATNANPVVFTATAHNFDYQSAATILPAVFISGASSGWTGVNGMFVATPTSANAFSIPVDSTGFGAFTGQTLTVSTRAPRLNAPVWRIHRFIYDGSSNMIWNGWATDTTGTALNKLSGGTSAFSFACSNRTSLAYE